MMYNQAVYRIRDYPLRFDCLGREGNLDLRTSHQDTGDRASAEHGVLYGLHAVLVGLLLRLQKFGKTDQEFVICLLLVSSGSEVVDSFSKHTISKKLVHTISKFIVSFEVNHDI
ncbi:hypothetical [Prochlorococcus marinus str. MIT 9313]|uniref:Uncharacterized protein n=1 Tax=Prochlorococcus marinus (strain MIT 9313) TaxID=74547 RepID=Q7V813_PROMM|nr:hypothetical [Prochlorococcus marinus str. MIT 9313]